MRQALQVYTTSFNEEAAFIPSFITLLESEFAFQRSHLPGHLTGSTWIIDSNREFVLLTHHAKLNKWLQPGGHADGEEDIAAVALREAEEETGLKKFTFLQEGIFDIDIHLIPARKDMDAHHHYDVRFLLEANINDPLILTEESHALAWVKLSELDRYNNSSALARMAEKIKRSNV